MGIVGQVTPAYYNEVTAPTQIPANTRMVSLQPALTSLLDSLPPHPIDQQQLDSLVRKTLDGFKSKLSPDIRKSQWEYLLRHDIFNLAVMLISTVPWALPHNPMGRLPKASHSQTKIMPIMINSGTS